ncbi:MAG: DUF1150 domain-containing protein [Rhizobiales bacterium]|nr:DUF1150 domain-containing protein [Hyphomicrobiales bacterium]MBI3673011.1 DUF1150 domain-containing protein [Hyphomicrobiales bacterium]
MNAENVKKTLEISQQDFARLGGGALAYIREIETDEAVRLLGSPPAMAPNTKLFCLYNADGSPVSISGSREAAIGSAFEHELLPMSVH